jgi:hypothetical protein
MTMQMTGIAGPIELRVCYISHSEQLHTGCPTHAKMHVKFAQ